MTYLCTNPVLGARLPDYIASLLDDAASEQVEAHLNDCPHCKEHYLTILRASAQVQSGVRARYEGRERDEVPPPLAQRKASNGS